MYPILEKEFLSPTIARFVLRAPFIAPKRQAGIGGGVGTAEL